MFGKGRAPLGLRFFEWVRQSARESGFANAIEHFGLEGRAEQSAVMRYFDERRRKKVRMLCMRAREGSRILQGKRAIKRFLLRGSLSSYGAFLLLSASFCLLGRLARGSLTVGDPSFLTCAVLLIAAIPCLQDRRPLVRAMESSMICQWLLLSVCRQSLDGVNTTEETGEQRRSLTFFCAVIAGGLATFLPPLYLVLLAMLSLTRRVLFAVPELLFLVLLVGLPFWSLAPHPSVVLVSLTSIASAIILFKMLVGHCVIRFGALELLIGAFSLMLLCGGREGILQAVLLFSFIPLEYFFSKRVWRERATVGICISACICSGIGILQYLLFAAELKWVDASRFSDIGGRVTSVFSNPNVLAVYLLLTFPIAFAIPGKGLWRRLLAVCTVGLNAACLLLTWSRGAWLGAIAALGIWLLLRSAKTMRVAVFSLLPVTVYLPLLPHSVANRFASIGDASESSIRYRLYTWRGVGRMLRVHPLGIGVGESAFAAVYPRFAVSGTESVPHTHNLLLQITTELGLGGVLCFLGILICLTVLVLTDIKCFFERDGMPIVLAGFCAIAGCLVMGFFDYVWYHKGLFWLFWAAMAMTASAARLAIEEHRKEEEIHASTTAF